MGWQETLQEALKSSPVQGSPLRADRFLSDRPPPKGHTGNRPHWNRKAYHIDTSAKTNVPAKDDPNYVEVSPGRFRYVPKGDTNAS